MSCFATDALKYWGNALDIVPAATRTKRPALANWTNFANNPLNEQLQDTWASRLLCKCRMGIYILGMGFVVSCASVGNKYNIEALPQLSPGTTTMAEVVTLLGEPTHRNTLPDGTTLLQWNYSTVVYTTVRGTHHAILFDNAGIMLRVTMDGKARMN